MAVSPMRKVSYGRTNPNLQNNWGNGSLCHPFIDRSNMLDNNCALFRDMNTSELHQVEELSKLKVLAKQQYLCAQMASTDQVYNIASGAAAIEHISSDGNRQILAFLFPGDFVGLSTQKMYDYGVKSLTKVTAYQFHRNQLLRLAEEIPTLEANLQNIQDRVLSRMLEQVYLLGQKNAHARICYLLIHLLERLPGATADRIELPMNRQDIADYLGLTVETVSRSITKLKNDGLIKLPCANSVTILDLDEVADLANID